METGEAQSIIKASNANCGILGNRPPNHRDLYTWKDTGFVCELRANFIKIGGWGLGDRFAVITPLFLSLLGLNLCGLWEPLKMNGLSMPEKGLFVRNHCPVSAV